eukprot:COSAG01_NODE_51165_length_357_cov_0.569767_1_plen_86_part_00
MECAPCAARPPSGTCEDCTKRPTFGVPGEVPKNRWCKGCAQKHTGAVSTHRHKQAAQSTHLILTTPTHTLTPLCIYRLGHILSSI